MCCYLSPASGYCVVIICVPFCFIAQGLVEQERLSPLITFLRRDSRKDVQMSKAVSSTYVNKGRSPYNLWFVWVFVQSLHLYFELTRLNKKKFKTFKMILQLNGCFLYIFSGPVCVSSGCTCRRINQHRLELCLACVG